MKNQGFVLIELIIYVGLFSIMIGGLIISAFLLMDTSYKTDVRTDTQEEMNFVLKKLDWALIGAENINIPNPNTLEVTNPNIPGLITFQFDSSDEEINMKIGGGGFEPITTINVDVISTITKPTKFVLIPGGSTIIEGVNIFLNIDDQTTNLSKYLRYVP